MNLGQEVIKKAPSLTRRGKDMTKLAGRNRLRTFQRVPDQRGPVVSGQVLEALGG